MASGAIGRRLGLGGEGLIGGLRDSALSSSRLVGVDDAALSGFVKILDRDDEV